jgi:hypothetical protein
VVRSRSTGKSFDASATTASTSVDRISRKADGAIGPGKTIKPLSSTARSKELMTGTSSAAYKEGSIAGCGRSVCRKLAGIELLGKNYNWHLYSCHKKRGAC